jgi:hypothetical protein
MFGKMSSQLIGIVLGGIIPAILLGFLAVCQKFGGRIGIASSVLCVGHLPVRLAADLMRFLRRESSLMSITLS